MLWFKKKKQKKQKITHTPVKHGKSSAYTRESVWVAPRQQDAI